ncbi:UDP-glucose 4-epimerase GalE [Mailhella sp.]|uniref:UDP-glucose 4-epimerase GalE n=1 Tax=Mailhella sp. TaxID=1981029 RepID=UPI0040641DDF
MAILVTGGCGYIGSHTTLRLLEEGYDVIVVDNLANSHEESLRRVAHICGRKAEFHKLDVCNEKGLRILFQMCREQGREIEAAIHFAGLKSVGESTQIPLEYYRNNLISTLSLVKVMEEFDCKRLVFSSSATVYGNPKVLPITEDAPTGGVTNAYGRSKLIIEDILRDIHAADESWNIALLRYFNPVGAHESGLIGEDPQGIPNNLVPYISRVAAGTLEQVSVFGGDYPTPDGTGVRDYIHVMDLAEGHLAALAKLPEKPGLCIYNLGTGQGYSVLEMIHAFEEACGHEIAHIITARRPGDIAACCADASKAWRELGWKTTRGLAEMMRDSWNWQKNNPKGYMG